MTERERLALPPIPDPPSPPWLEQFIATYPEAAERIEEAQRRGSEERTFATFVVQEIYDHYATGSPSRWGLIVTLRAFANMLEDAIASAPGRRRPRRNEDT